MERELLLLTLVKLIQCMWAQTELAVLLLMDI